MKTQLLLAILDTTWGTLPSAFADGTGPNILFILSDDQDPDTLSCFGGKVLTPTLDKLCRDGVKFTRAYNSSSVCTPSRYTCLTGQYAGHSQALHLRQCERTTWTICAYARHGQQVGRATPANTPAGQLGRFWRAAEKKELPKNRGRERIA